MSNTLLWFRNDLRIDDNPALERALKQGCKKALFFKTEKQWQLHDMAEIKQDFIMRHVFLLKSQLKPLGIELEVVEVNDYKEQTHWLINYCQKHSVATIFANTELELNEVIRDNALINSGVKLDLSQADTVLPLGIVLNKQGEMFKVFTPFKKEWLSHFASVNTELPPTANLPVEHTDDTSGVSKEWPLASVFLQQNWSKFLTYRIEQYHNNRDIPALPGTARVSPYLAIGAISAKRLVSDVYMHYQGYLTEHNEGAQVWLSEIIWREFYRNLLFHYPNLIKGKSFVAKYDNLLWPEQTGLFEKWCEAKTGFPIVDAAMRQLTQIGWMHNRLRMVVASFLTKNLLVDWRLGERFFMQHLIDGDFAANNGGWQWSASTGCDAQPYFRVFNPVSQSKKFDPNGEFIRKYLPELKNVPDKHIHQPHKYLAETGQSSLYWPELVDLKITRQQAIEFYGMKYDSANQA